jgi:hypothetical protein
VCRTSVHADERNRTANRVRPDAQAVTAPGGLVTPMTDQCPNWSRPTPISASTSKSYLRLPVVLPGSVRDMDLSNPRTLLEERVSERAEHRTEGAVQDTCSFARAERLLSNEYHGRFLIELL